MSEFNYQNGVLCAENVPLTTLSDTFGTPLYVYSRKAFTDQFNAYKNALGDWPGLVCYAVKANSNLAVLNVLAKLGAGFDIVSEGELERVLASGGSADKIVFSGVGKKSYEIERALEVGVHCFNVESESELDRIQTVASRMGKKAPISLRINPDVDAKTHPYISTGLKENKFGIDINEAPRVYAKANAMPNLCVKGVDFHIGSQLTDMEPFMDALDRALSLIDTLAEQGITLEHIDLGGGIGVTYQDEQPIAIDDYLNAVKAKLGARALDIVLEPGRSISANAGVFVTNIEFIKHTEHKDFAIVDGAMNDLIRPALYQAWQDIVPVTQRTSGDARNYDVVGPVCETADALGKDRSLVIEQGDLLAVMSSGAYGFVMASNYNSRPRCAEIMVDGDQAHVVRERETLASLFDNEHVLNQ